MSLFKKLESHWIWYVVPITLAFAASIITQQHGIDLYVLYNAGKAVLSGANPYTMPLKFYTPAWSLLILTPLALLPYKVVCVLWSLAAVAVWTRFLYVLEVRPMDIAIFLINPFCLYGFVMGSYDWWILLGLLMPLRYGVWLLFLKPQASVGILVYALARGSIKNALLYVAPTVFIVGSLLYGFYRQPVLADMTWNHSLGFMGVAVGLYLVSRAVWKKEVHLSIAASPFLSPYVGIQTWALSLLAIPTRAVLVLAVLLSWLIVLL